MARFLFAMSLETGHILPTLKVATDLIHRGHTVTYLCRDRIERELMARGIPSITLGDGVQLPHVERSLFMPCVSADLFYKTLCATISPTATWVDLMKAEIEKATAILSPDVVVIDAVKDWRASLCSHVESFCRVLPLCVHFRDLTAFRQDGYKRQVVCMCPSQLELPELRDKSIYYGESGYVPLAPIRKSVWERYADGRAIFYMSLGSQCRQYEAARSLLDCVVQTASEMPEGFFIVADNLESECAKPLPNNVTFAPVATQQRVLDSASAMILHGGLGSIKDCIYSETPMIVIPQKWDQPGNAMRVEANNLGVQLHSAVDTRGLLAALRMILRQKAFHRSLIRMKKMFSHADSHQSVAHYCDTVVLH